MSSMFHHPDSDDSALPEIYQGDSSQNFNISANDFSEATPLVFLYSLNKKPDTVKRRMK